MLGQSLHSSAQHANHLHPPRPPLPLTHACIRPVRFYLGVAIIVALNGGAGRPLVGEKIDIVG